MEPFDFDNHSDQFSRKNAYWLGQASSAAYVSTFAESMANDWGMNFFKTLGQTEEHGFAAGNDEMLILAFRGTDSVEDWVNNINFDVIHGPGGEVHQGFISELNGVWNEVRAIVAAHRGSRKLWITGHSLGAALATLAAAKLEYEEGQRVDGLYTFGQPRTGKTNFAQNFNTKFAGRAFRYVNNNDVVPHLPSRSMKFSHIGTLKYFDCDGNEKDDVNLTVNVFDSFKGYFKSLFRSNDMSILNRVDGWKDHMMAGYLDNLKRARQFS